MTARSRLLVRLCVAFALSAFARAQDAQPLVDDGTREWNQERGSPRCDASNDVAPILRRPVEAWRFAFERVLAEPVVWGGVVYAFGEHQGKSRLVALDLETGAVLGPSLVLDGVSPAHLAVWRGFVAVARPGALALFAFQGGRFVVNGPAHSGSWPSALSSCGRFLVACDGAGSLVVFDFETGTELARGTAHGGQPALRPTRSAGELAVATLRIGQRPPPDPDHFFPGTYLAVESRAVRRLGLVPVHVDEPALAWIGACADEAADVRALATSTVTWLAQRAANTEPRSCVRSSAPLAVEKKQPMCTAIDGRYRVPLASPFALTPLDGWGFDAGGRLLSCEGSGAYQIVLEPAQQPAGARRGATTLARRTLYAPNWAFDVDTRTVLWVDAQLAPASALLPVADGRALYVSSANEIVLLREPASANVRGGAATSSASVPTLPGSGEGIVLADGRRVAGAVTLDGGRVTVKEASGRETFYVAAEVALVETQRSVKRFGDEAPVERACWLVHARALATALADVCLRYSDKDFVDDGLRVVHDLEALGHDPARVRELERLFAGRRTNRTEVARISRAPIAEAEAKARADTLAALRASAAWLQKNQLATAATVLLARGRVFAPAGAPDTTPASAADLALARSFVPAGWRHAREADAPVRWQALAAALLPAGGVLLAPEDPLRADLKTPSAREAPLALASRNLLLASRCEDPDAIGTILVDGERALRQLDRLFGDAQTRTKHVRRLPAIIFESSAAYHADGISAGQDLEWASGHFDSVLGTSAFFVEWSAGDGPRRMVSRGVVAHELTHHWLATRWAGADGRAAPVFESTPGFWAVEGVARFVEEQVERMDVRGERLDDESVDSLEFTARVQELGQTFPLARFVQLTGKEQHALATQNEVEFTSRRTGWRHKLSRMGIFYAQAGSLAYFLVHHPRKPRHAELALYLREIYANRLDAQGWTLLGWTDLAELESEFKAFLAAH